MSGPTFGGTCSDCDTEFRREMPERSAFMESSAIRHRCPNCDRPVYCRRVVATDPDTAAPTGGAD